jgi:glycosyltransferase involved in cell wall biosynthesis
VIFLPPRPVAEMPRLNAMADALLVHLRDEPFLRHTVPSKTQVSLLAGRPVLMGCRGEAARIVEDATAGICFAPEDGTALAEAVRELVALPPDARTAMGARGASYYERHLSLRAGAAVMNRLFSELMPKDDRHGQPVARARAAALSKS